MKFPKNGQTTVRYSKELFEELKKNGWTIQSLLDWAVEQKTKVELHVSTERKKVKKVK